AASSATTRPRATWSGTWPKSPPGPLRGPSRASAPSTSSPPATTRSAPRPSSPSPRRTDCRPCSGAGRSRTGASRCRIPAATPRARSWSPNGAPAALEALAPEDGQRLLEDRRLRAAAGEKIVLQSHADAVRAARTGPDRVDAVAVIDEHVPGAARRLVLQPGPDSGVRRARLLQAGHVSDPRGGPEDVDQEALLAVERRA